MPKDIVDIAGSFAPQGTSSPNPTSSGGEYVVTRSDVGTYVLTFNRAFSRFICGTTQVQAHTLTPVMSQLGDFASTSPNRPANITITVMLTATGAATDIAANANNQIHFRFTFLTV